MAVRFSSGARRGSVRVAFLSLLACAGNGLCARVVLAQEAHAAVTDREARAAMIEARSALQDARHADAIAALSVVERFAPEIADRLAELRGNALLESGAHEAACEAFAIARQSPEPTVALRARVGAVRCLLRSGDRRGVDALRILRRDMPGLPEAPALELDVAIAHERWGDRAGAMRAYRALDLQWPASASAENAREAMTRLAAEGIRRPPLSVTEQIDRAERLLQGAGIEVAKPSVLALRVHRDLPRRLRQRVSDLSARLARYEARLQQNEDGASPPDRGAAPAAAPRDPPRDAMASAIRAATRGRPSARWTADQIAEVVRIAAQHGARETAQATLARLRARSNVAAGIRFGAAIDAMGVAPDAEVDAMLQTLEDDPALSAASRYHRARIAERAGDRTAAEALFRGAIEADRTETRWYAFLSRQHGVSADTDAASARTSTENRSNNSGKPSIEEPTHTQTITEDTVDPIAARVAELLTPLLQQHRDTYPWLARAIALARVGEYEEASDELHAAYTEYRRARGSAPLRAGLEAVFLGQAPRGDRLDARRKRALLALTEASRERMAEAAEALGDFGTAAHFGGRARTSRHPRAHEDAVEAAARRQGLDPNLLFAIMRVESVFDRRIVSYAGAIGLMQIMPRTASLIAEQLARPDHVAHDLLDPDTNIAFAAWYFASLLRRFEGRLPLAIAAYNAGPHNVRRWMREHGAAIPLDAFLERIPFEQTHRYVRRVLNHYNAYRAQRGLEMPPFPLSLPPDSSASPGF